MTRRSEARQESWLEALIAEVRPLEQWAVDAARRRQDSLTKPQGSLGRLEGLSLQIAGITGQPIPVLRDKVIVTMAADHGVVAEGVSAYPQAVTVQMVENFRRGGAAVNVLARLVGARVVVVDVGVASALSGGDDLIGLKIAPGTSNLARGPAMTREQALRALKAGADVLESELARGLDIVALGDMGIGNTTAAAAVASALTGRPPSELVGRGTGVDDPGFVRKIAAVERSLAINRPDAGEPLDVLAKVGGFELGGLAGVALAAAARRRPVVIDGYPATAAAMLAMALAPGLGPFLIAGHRSRERGHAAMLDWLGLRPILDLEMGLGEGTGAALALFLIEAACRTLGEMATFEEAGVSRKATS